MAVRAVDEILVYTFDLNSQFRYPRNLFTYIEEVNATIAFTSFTSPACAVHTHNLQRSGTGV